MIAQNYLLGNVTETSLTGNLTHARDKVKAFKEERTYKSAPKPNRSPVQYPQGARRIRKAAKPPTAARRVRFGKEEQRNERTLTF